MVILRDSALDYDSAVMVREFVIISPAMKRTLNTTINRSKSEKNDEHYTQLADIENEVRHYRDQFRDAMRIIKVQGFKVSVLCLSIFCVQEGVADVPIYSDTYNMTLPARMEMESAWMNLMNAQGWQNEQWARSEYEGKVALPGYS